MRVGIFEDSEYINLLPLTYLRPVFDLRCGMYLLRQKIERRFTNIPTNYYVRNTLLPLLNEKYPDRSFNKLENEDTLFINGAVLFDADLAKQLSPTKISTVYTLNHHPIAAFILKKDINTIQKDEEGLLSFDHFSNLTEIRGITRLNYPWEFVHENGDQIGKDFQLSLKGQTWQNPSTQGVHLLNSEQIYIAPSARVDPGVVIDAEEGPVFIDENAHILPQATIIGPAYIGPKSLVKIGAKIYEGTSLGEVCKVGGEVEESIIHSFSNKQHDGFLGHAYLGQWVNLGADTNNSDLKNNYGSVRVYVNGKEVDSGSTFVGLTMGDHSKSGINTMFNTGTVVGIMCNIFGSDFPPKWIPSYAWGGSAGFVEHDFERAVKLAKKVMARRKVELGNAEENLMRQVFEKTKNEREASF